MFELSSRICTIVLENKSFTFLGIQIMASYNLKLLIDMNSNWIIFAWSKIRFPSASSLFNVHTENEADFDWILYIIRLISTMLLIRMDQE